MIGLGTILNSAGIVFGGLVGLLAILAAYLPWHF